MSYRKIKDPMVSSRKNNVYKSPISGKHRTTGSLTSDSKSSDETSTKPLPGTTIVYSISSRKSERMAIIKKYAGYKIKGSCARKRKQK